MKLAEALILRADLQNRMEQLRQRLSANALVQEGEKPAEDPEELLQELQQNTDELEALIAKINLTNASTVIGERTLTEMLAQREALTLQISILRTLLASASKTVMRGSRMEVKIYSTVQVADLQKQTDGFARQLRQLDTEIQSANWLTELR